MHPNIHIVSTYIETSPAVFTHIYINRSAHSVTDLIIIEAHGTL